MPTTYAAVVAACRACGGTGVRIAHPNAGIPLGSPCPACQGEGSFSQPVAPAPTSPVPIAIVVPTDGANTGLRITSYHFAAPLE